MGISGAEENTDVGRGLIDSDKKVIPVRGSANECGERGAKMEGRLTL